jgi:hypothetical protein
MDWWSDTESPKAWMSVRDADLYEVLLHRVVDKCGGRTVRVVEWGAGRSTVWYTRFLDSLGVPYLWLALEHDRGFFEGEVAPELTQDTAVVVRYEDVRDHDLVGGTGVRCVVFDYGSLFPGTPGREGDRLVPMDDYVGLPRALGVEADLVVIDGRQRRRCLLEAAGLIGKDGYVLLHDAWRAHYQCAFEGFRSGRRFGDEWWIGAQRDTDFSDVLPWYAFTGQLSGPPRRTEGVKGAWRRAFAVTAKRIVKR